MDRVVFVEVLDRRGRVAQRVRLDAFPAGIGRAYTNAVILDDRYVSPEHCRLVADPVEGLVLENRGSANGVFDAARGRRVERLVVAPAAQVRVGRTVLRFCYPDQPVPAPLVDGGLKAGVARLLAGTRAGILGSAVVVALVAGTSYLGSYQRVRVAEPLAAGLLAWVGLVVWAGAWAVLTRLVSHRFEFLTHMALAAAALVGLFALDRLFSYAEFFWPGGGGFPYLEWLATAALVAALLFGHFSVAWPTTRRRRLLTAATLSVSFFGLIELVNYAERDERSTWLQFTGHVKPIGAALLPAKPLDGFLDDVAGMQAELDSLASR